MKRGFFFFVGNRLTSGCSGVGASGAVRCGVDVFSFREKLTTPAMLVEW